MEVIDPSRSKSRVTSSVSLSKRTGAAALINQCFRHAHGTTIYGGTSEVQRIVIGRHILR